MALITCNECGRQISDRASSCPGCGAPVAGNAPVQQLIDAGTDKTAVTGLAAWLVGNDRGCGDGPEHFVLFDFLEGDCRHGGDFSGHTGLQDDDRPVLFFQGCDLVAAIDEAVLVDKNPHYFCVCRRDYIHRIVRRECGMRPGTQPCQQ